MAVDALDAAGVAAASAAEFWPVSLCDTSPALPGDSSYGLTTAGADCGAKATGVDPQAIASLSSDDVLAGGSVSGESCAGRGSQQAGAVADGMAHDLRAEPRRVEDGADERVGEERVDELRWLPS